MNVTVPERLSKNFTRSEFACKCGCGLPPSPSSELIEGLQALREVIGRPVHVLSGCRCPAHNKAVGGTEHSQHLLGRAADISVTGMTARQLYATAASMLRFKGFGVSDKGGFLHVDVRDKLARWCYGDDGKECGWREERTREV